MSDYVEERLDRAEWEHREIYARFGLDVYFAQVLEAGGVNFLLLTRALRGKRGGDFDVDATFQRLFGNVLGQNIKELRDVFGNDWELAEQLRDALEIRNDLVHHYMRTHIMKFGSGEGRGEMLAELESYRERLE